MATRRTVLASYVVKNLDEGLSPEQIAGRLKLENGSMRLSHETIYQYIYSDVGLAKKLYLHLVRRKPKRSTRIGRKPRQSHIPESNAVIGGIHKKKKAWPKSAFKSVTFDRGTEFASYRNLGIPTYCCNPHSPWQKGANENFNGRLRRYLPKNYNPKMLSQTLLDNIAAKMNNQTRKCLGFKTPYEVFYANLQKGVALET